MFLFLVYARCVTKRFLALLPASSHTGMVSNRVVTSRGRNAPQSLQRKRRQVGEGGGQPRTCHAAELLG